MSRDRCPYMTYIRAGGSDIRRICELTILTDISEEGIAISARCCQFYKNHKQCPLYQNRKERAEDSLVANIIPEA